MTLQAMNGGVATFPQLKQPLVALSDQSPDFAQFFEKMKGLVMALAEQNLQLELALISSQARIQAIDVLGKARTVALKERVTDLENNVTTLTTYRREEGKKAEKDLEDVVESQKRALQSIDLVWTAKINATEQALRTRHRIELPQRIQAAIDKAISETKDACNAKLAISEKALKLKQKKQIRKIIDATRKRLAIEYNHVNYNTVIPALTQKRNYHLPRPTTPEYYAADAAFRGASSLVNYLFPEHFFVVGFDMRITND